MKYLKYQQNFLLAILCGSFLYSSLVLANDHYSSRLRVGIIGDQTGATDIQEAYSILQEGVNQLSNLPLDVVIHVGDLLESREPVNVYTSLFTQGTSILDQLHTPWFMTPGDHDVNPPVFQQNSDDRSKEMLFQALYSTRVPQVEDHLYYSFDVNGYHFVSLYSHEHLHVDPRWGNVFLAQISEEQREWLAQDLNDNRDAKAIVVFLHQPLWYNWSSWKRVHDILRQHSVAAVIAGHFHYNQNEGKIDGIRYVVVGATGGNIKQAGANSGGSHHVTLMDLKTFHRPHSNKNKHRIKFKLLPIGNTEPQSLTPRRDMDRIQVIDQMLGELWNFGSVNPVFLKDNQLVASCETNEPATLKVASLGNPIDVSLRMEIDFESTETISTISAGFAPNVCEQVISDYECIVAPSTRIFVSNTSVVMVDSYSGPVWESGLTLTGAPPPSGTPLNLSVRMAFQSDFGELFVENRVSTVLSICSP
jgi:3',5'-cyclic AMP phosphodiesterase CpdA